MNMLFSGPLTVRKDIDGPATVLGVISGGDRSCKGVAVCGDITKILPWIKNTTGIE